MQLKRLVWGQLLKALYDKHTHPPTPFLTVLQLALQDIILILISNVHVCREWHITHTRYTWSHKQSTLLQEVSTSQDELEYAHNVYLLALATTKLQEKSLSEVTPENEVRIV
jgi:hypothetical protein